MEMAEAEARPVRGRLTRGSAPVMAVATVVVEADGTDPTGPVPDGWALLSKADSIEGRL